MSLISRKEPLNKTPGSNQPHNHIFFDLIEMVGSMGKYQVYAELVWCVMIYMSGGLLFVTPFLFFQDPYQCSSSLSQEACLNFVCSLNQSERQQYIPKNPTIVSLANKYGDYRCPSQESYLNLIESIMYSGFPFGILVLALVGDLITKKRFMLVNMFLSIIGLVMVVAAQGILVGGIGMFLCIFGLNINLNICFPYVTETVSSKYRPSFSMLIMASYSVGALANVFWFYIFRDYSPVIIYFYGIPAVFSVLSLIFFIKDSPICMITKSSPERALRGLRHIAQINNKELDFALTVAQLHSIQQQYKEKVAAEVKKKRTFTILDLFRYKSLRLVTLKFIFLDIAISLQYNTPTLMMSQFNFSIFLNGLVIQSSELLASILSIYLIYKLSRRIVACVSFLIIFASAFALIFIWNQNETSASVSSNIVVLVFVFVIVFVITNEFNFYVIYINELYPTQVRIIALGFIKTFGGIVLMVDEQIISACINSGFRIMILFTILAGLSSLISFTLPETKDRMPKDIIDELQIQEEEKILLDQQLGNAKKQLEGQGINCSIGGEGINCSIEGEEQKDKAAERREECLDVYPTASKSGQNDL